MSKFCDEVKNISWRKKIRYNCNKFVIMSKHIMTSNSSQWHQKVRHDVKNMIWWHKVRHCFKMFIMTRQNVRHDVKSSCILLWHQKVGYIQNSSWCQNARHYTKKYFITPKIRHGVRKFALTSKYSSWCKHTSWWQNVRHYFKRFVKKM